MLFWGQLMGLFRNTRRTFSLRHTGLKHRYQGEYNENRMGDYIWSLVGESTYKVLRKYLETRKFLYFFGIWYDIKSWKKLYKKAYFFRNVTNPLRSFKFIPKKAHIHTGNNSEIFLPFWNFTIPFFEYRSKVCFCSFLECLY